MERAQGTNPRLLLPLPTQPRAFPGRRVWLPLVLSPSNKLILGIRCSGTFVTAGLEVPLTQGQTLPTCCCELETIQVPNSASGSFGLAFGQTKTAKRDGSVKRVFTTNLFAEDFQPGAYLQSVERKPLLFRAACCSCRAAER